MEQNAFEKPAQITYAISKCMPCYYCKKPTKSHPVSDCMICHTCFESKSPDEIKNLQADIEKNKAEMQKFLQEQIKNGAILKAGKDGTLVIEKKGDK